MPKLQIACNTPVADGMVVHTQTRSVDAGRGDDPRTAARQSSAGLSDLRQGRRVRSARLRDGVRRAAPPTSPIRSAQTQGRRSRPDDRARRRALRRLPALRALRRHHRRRTISSSSRIAAPRHHRDRDRRRRTSINFTGNVTEICPVGALTSKTYRFKSRPWDLHRTQTTCTQCPVGCQQFSRRALRHVLRTMSVEHDDAISDGWLCDRGRYNIGFYASPERLTQPLYKQERRLRANRLGRCVRAVGESDQDARSTERRAPARSAAAVLQRRSVSVCSTSSARSACAISTGAAARSVKRRPGKNGGRFVALESAKAIVIAGDSPEELAPVLVAAHAQSHAQRREARITSHGERSCRDVGADCIGRARRARVGRRRP